MTSDSVSLALGHNPAVALSRMLIRALGDRRSGGLMRGDFCDQHWSTPFRHHSALLLRRANRPSTDRTKTGLVWAEPRMRRAIQLLR